MSTVSTFSSFIEFKGNMQIDEVIRLIKDGEYNPSISRLRQLVIENSPTAEKVKKSLPAFTPSGTFDLGRLASLLQSYSGFIVLDFDKIPADKYHGIFEKATGLPTTYACFRSPGGNGIKILVRHSAEASIHEMAFSQIAEFYEKELDFKIDHSGKDVCRLCFFSFDPDLYHNPDSQTFQITNNSDIQIVACVTDDTHQELSDTELAYRKAVEFTENKIAFVNGSRNNFVHLLACNCNRNGINETDALTFIQRDFDFNGKEVRSAVKSAYSKNISEFGKYAQLKQSHISESESPDDDSDKWLDTPFIPETIYHNLPNVLKSGCNTFRSNREKDMFLTGALTVLSGCMVQVHGIYDGRKMFPNLFCFVIAPAASGKGALSFSKVLGMKYHKRLKENSIAELRQYEADLEEYKASKSKKAKDNVAPIEYPVKPDFKILFIPANSSSAAVIGHLAQSESSGIIFETEADTMANSFKQDWGGYSDLLRKAFQHESVTYSRKANAEFIEVDHPCISVALSGTPSQIQGLISSAEDGLFSRFIFYIFKVKPEWRDVSPQSEKNFTDFFNDLSLLVEQMIDFLNTYPTEVLLSEEQWGKLNSCFSQWLNEVSAFVSEEIGSTVKRLGLIVFRIAMVLTAIRKFENADLAEKITCDDTDFQTALSLAEVYKQHAILMYSILPKSQENHLPRNKKAFYDALPSDKPFTHKEAVIIGDSLGIKDRTVAKYLKQLNGTFIDQPLKYGQYRKIA